MTVLFCNCSYSAIIPTETRRAVHAALTASGVELITVADLCGAAARKDAVLREINSAVELTVVACYPRSVRWLFSYAGMPVGEDVRIMNMRTQTAEEILKTIGIVPVDPDTVPAYSAPAVEWIPWFPVLDYDRCTSCKQCVSFCPFGVYDVSAEDQVRVAHPEKCKNNCPACSRMCPGTAIIFPKYTEEQYSGGEIGHGTDGQESPASVEASLEGKDLHEILARRRAFAQARKGNKTR